MTQRAPVIRAAWYQPQRRQLDLMFASGHHYRYADVPADIARQFAGALSKGRFYNQQIRDRFACTTLDLPLNEAA